MTDRFKMRFQNLLLLWVHS